MYSIYLITNIKNNKIYIGQTNNLYQRWAQYKSAAKHASNDMVITRALRKHGIENFSFQPIATAKTLEDINHLETLMIRQFNSTNPNIGYNIDEGGGVTTRSALTCQKISEGLRKHYETHTNWNKGGTLPEEWRKALSEAAMGKPGTNIAKEFDDEWSLNISKSLSGKERKQKRRFSEEQEREICRLYVEEEKSTYALGNDFEASRSLIISILKRNEVVMRESNYTGHSNGRNILNEVEQMKACIIYQKGNISIKALAKQFSCGSTTMRDILLRHSIDLVR
jgi:group I intron endonuclease